MDDGMVNEVALSAEEEAELDAEMAVFAQQEAERLGVDVREHHTETVHDTFTQSDKAHTTLLFGGLTLAHDEMIANAMLGLGYKIENLEIPGRGALQFGKEFGNRGQCNPTYFTVGNLVKHLIYLRDVRRLSTRKIIDSYVFVTVGACGPCRFGMYATEYRKALRDAGFDGFRVLLFQQQGGIEQATGEASGLEITAAFGLAFIRALLLGDVINLLGYRLRPYEVVEGSTDIALAQCKKLVGQAVREHRSVLFALLKCRRLIRQVQIDRTIPKPVVSIIGEFWAMTTEGDGNYGMYRFLESEGAEVDIQPIVNWLLYLCWDVRFDIVERMKLRHDDVALKGLAGTNPTRMLWAVWAMEKGLVAWFQLYANLLGLHGYHLADMDQMGELAKNDYDLGNRGGEGHLEVGKLIHFITDRINHMTLSIKPFGCMPSSGVSDGIQSTVTSRYPEAIFLALETTGDQKVNAYSRVQMMLFKARQRTRQEFERALEVTGLTEEEFKRKVKVSRRWRNPLSRPKHRVAGAAANLVYAVGD